MAESSRPWDTSEMYAARWRQLHNALAYDGVCNDLTGAAFGLSYSGSTTITVGAGEYFIQGAHYVNDSGKALNVGAIGTQPTAGQTRRDLVVVRYDATSGQVTIELKPGTPATSGAAEPGLTRNPTGIWEAALYAITRLGNVAVNSGMVSDRRRYTGPILSGPAWNPASDVPLGAIAFTWNDIAARRMVSGSPAWDSVLDPAWVALTAAAGMAASATPGSVRRRSGLIELSGGMSRTSGSFTAGVHHIGTVPTTARPAIRQRLPAVALAAGNALAPCAIEIYGAGEADPGRIYATLAAGVTSVFLTGHYPAPSA